MITPQFSVRQDENNIHIDIKAAFIKANDVEFVVDGNVFIFSLPPYYLRLRFNQQLKQDNDEEDDESRNSWTSYDMGSSMIKVRIPKEVPGEEFTDLDMLTKLLARKDEDHQQQQASMAGKPLIQELDQGVTEQAIKQAESFDWEIEQHVPEPMDEESAAVAGAYYGFDDQYTGQVAISIQSGNDINELEDPEHCSVQDRIQTRIDMENEKFDENHYLADLMEPEYINELVSYVPKFDEAEFTQPEKDKMTQLPRKSYALIRSPKQVYLNLIGILFAWAYDNRTTMSDPTVETAWTIGKLCPLVSTLDSHFTTLKPLAVSCSRRALSFPLFRNWDLVKAVWRDVYQILKSGASDLRVIVRILVQIVQQFDTSDHCYYVYNRIWFQDYASWVQGANPTVIRSLAHEVNKLELTKQDMGWELNELEQAAMEVANQAPDSDDEI